MKLYGKPYTTILLIASFAVPFLWYYNQTRLPLWNVSWYSVFLLMIIRPLADLFPKQKWIRKLVPYRKEFGILSAMVVVSNAFYRYIPMGEQFFPVYFSTTFWDFTKPYAYGRLAELVGFVLLVTSNTFSKKLLKKWWKRIQRTSYVYYYGAAVLLISYNKTDVLVTAVFTAIVGTLAAFKRRGVWPGSK